MLYLKETDTEKLEQTWNWYLTWVFYHFPEKNISFWKINFSIFSQLENLTININCQSNVYCSFYLKWKFDIWCAHLLDSVTFQNNHSWIFSPFGIFLTADIAKAVLRFTFFLCVMAISNHLSIMGCLGFPRVSYESSGFLSVPYGSFVKSYS